VFVVGPLLFFTLAGHSDRLMIVDRKDARVLRPQFLIAAMAFGRAGQFFFPARRHGILLSLRVAAFRPSGRRALSIFS
jgi:hypothetical protein